MGAAITTTLIANLKAILATGEPDDRAWSSVLAERLGVVRSTGWRLLNRGCDNVSSIQQIATALNVSPYTLIDQTVVGTVVDYAMLRMGNADYPCLAWLETALTMPMNADRLMARLEHNDWRIARFAAGVRQPCRRVIYFEGHGAGFQRDIAFESAAVKAALIANMQAVMAMDEPDDSTWAGLLADRIGVSRQKGWRLRNQGTDSVSTIEQIASALDVSPFALIDQTLVGKMVVRARLRLDEADYPCVTWLAPEPSVPGDATDLVARFIDGDWRLARFADGPQTPSHRVIYFEGRGDPYSRSVCVVVTFVEGDMAGAEDMAAGLARSGFAVVPHANLDELQSFCRSSRPDIAILLANKPEDVAMRINQAAGTIVPAVILHICPEPEMNRPDLGLFVSYPDELSMLYTIRAIVHFSRPLVSQRPTTPGGITP